MVVGSINLAYPDPSVLYYSLVNPWFCSTNDRPAWYSEKEWGNIDSRAIQRKPDGAADQKTFGGSNSENNVIGENLMECACGCGGKPAVGKFLPGHDQRLRADLERRVGGLIQLRMLVEAAENFTDGSIGSSMFNSMVKDLLQDRRESQ